MPVASIGGDVAGCRLAILQGVPVREAGACMVPGGLGALEGSFVLFGALFGLPADTALAISLSKRVRELALGVPGLFAWHWIESRYLLRRADSIVT